HGRVRIRERHGAVIAEDQVEGRVGERQLFGACPDQREPDAGLDEVRLRGGELVRAEVQTSDVGASHRDLDAELARAAAELQRAETRDVAQRLDLVFGDVAYAPREYVPPVEVRSVAFLVGDAVGLPGRHRAP